MFYICSNSACLYNGLIRERRGAPSNGCQQAGASGMRGRHPLRLSFFDNKSMPQPCVDNLR